MGEGNGEGGRGEGRVKGRRRRVGGDGGSCDVK